VEAHGLHEYLFKGAASTSVIDVCDEVGLYYGGANHTHGDTALYDSTIDGRGTKVTTAIGLATWKRDRFVSADAPASGGTLTTVPLRFAGKRLEVNAVMKRKNKVWVDPLVPTAGA
jgi:hypothetical protein